MAAAGTLDDRHKVVIGSICAVDDVIARYVFQLVRVRECDAFERPRLRPARFNVLKVALGTVPIG